MRHKSALRIVLEPLAVAVLLAIAARSAFRLFAIPTASMAPTLQPGDVVVATPYRFSDPATGDVVVFRSLDGDELLVKRIVATAGELVEEQEGKLLVGGRPGAKLLRPRRQPHGVARQPPLRRDSSRPDRRTREVRHLVRRSAGTRSRRPARHRIAIQAQPHLQMDRVTC
jgi:signal peptidase I